MAEDLLQKSEDAKMVIRYFEGTMFPFLYNDHIVVTDESLELTAFGDGSPKAPFGFPRYEDNDLRGVEIWLEDCAEQFDNDGDTPGWEEAKAAFEAEERIATELAHIDKLRRHGAKVVINGELVEVNSYLWDKAMGECLTKGFKAVAYELREGWTRGRSSATCPLPLKLSNALWSPPALTSTAE